MCYIELEPCAVWAEVERQARKSHKCSSCISTIKAGETYIAHFHVFEGKASSQKMCLACHAARREFCADHDGMLMPPSEFRNMLIECIGENGGEEMEENSRWNVLLAELDARGEG